MGVKERYARTSQEVGRVCEETGRRPQDVTLVAVSKTVGLEEVALAIQGGARDFGENRPDQLMEKADRFPDVNWHFIGNIQSRRIRDIVGRATMIHSLFEERHARKIDEVARSQGIVQDVLLEVNVSGEESKSGLAPSDVPEMLKACADLQNMRVRGLMTMAPRGDLGAVERAFGGLAELRATLRSGLSEDRAAVFDELSMGMSEDWQVAIAKGATLVRIGRAIFSEDFV